MAIFSRRTIQGLINENNKFLLKSQTQRFVNLMNNIAKEPTLAYEWEIVLLYAFSRVGKVIHHRNFGGKSSPDIYFEIYGNPEKNFVADITTISDKGLDQNNPFEALSNDVHKIAKEYGLSGNSFHIQVGSRKGPTCKEGHKPELKLPGRARFSQIIFNEGFRNFLFEIIKSPRSIHHYNINTSDADVTIKYDPNQRFASGSYPGYKAMVLLNENPLYDALDRKLPQLIGIHFNGPLAIFLCDGGSDLFDKKPPTWFSYSTGDVINSFLLNNEKINFIVTFTTKPKNKYKAFHLRDDYKIVHKVYKGLKFDQIRFDIQEIIEQVKDVFPKPESTPLNALNYLKGQNPNLGRSNFGGMELSATKERTSVKISARALLELLAGKVSLKKFFEEYGFIQSELKSRRLFNPFNAALHRGQMIDSIMLKKSDLQDDDWITFELKGPDPAISPYVFPSTDEKSNKGK
jgi:hypothetical protein